MEAKLDVRNLIVSFRTINGKVQAVRDISFKLNKGETLAIVGESGSGKSVTSRAILGILAPNAIVEGGEIIYDGKDLLKINEDDFHKIRGDKIAMIFQDPMSSLNPIMKIGQQLTEAMLLKNIAFKRDAHKQLNIKLKALKDNAVEHTASDIEKKAVEEIVAKFVKFTLASAKLERAYNISYEQAQEALENVKDLLQRIEHKYDVEYLKYVKERILSHTKWCINDFVISNEKAENFKNIQIELKAAAAEISTSFIRKISIKIKNLFRLPSQKISIDTIRIVKALKSIQDILTVVVGYDKPDFFSLGYYITYVDKQIPSLSIKELNKLTNESLNSQFLVAFTAVASKSVAVSNNIALAAKRTVLLDCDKFINIINNQILDRKFVLEQAKQLISIVDSSIDKLAIYKDSVAYTFRSSLLHALDVYYGGDKRNAIENDKYNKQVVKFEMLKSKGKEPTWKITPPAIVDMELAVDNIKLVVKRLMESYTNAVSASNDFDSNLQAKQLVEYLQEKSSDAVYSVTRSMARRSAIKVMEEVGIPEPIKRFKQYPFQFSGGMRQRIVIAIALVANPDILICDEPTTALDVTIQSQILELINKLKVRKKLSVIFITHDLGVVANMADKIAVMYAGKIVEYGSSEDVFYSPQHPYTWALLSSMPDLHTKEKLEPIPGTPPNMIYPPKGDAFAARSKYAMEIDFEQQPPMFKISETHSAATWLLHPNAPKVEPPKIVSERTKRLNKTTGGTNNGK